MQLLRTAVAVVDASWWDLLCFFGFCMRQVFNMRCSEVPFDLVCSAVGPLLFLVCGSLHARTSKSPNLNCYLLTDRRPLKNTWDKCMF